MLGKDELKVALEAVSTSPARSSAFFALVTRPYISSAFTYARSGEPAWGAVISIQLILRNRPANFTAVIDTGFNGYLSVPEAAFWFGAEWLAIGTEKFEIATGEPWWSKKSTSERLSLVTGQRDPVYSVATEAQDILIGTKLMRGKTLMVNFRTEAGHSQIG